MTRTDLRVAFRATGDPEHPWEAAVGGRRWTVRLGDFPAEPLYTLLVEGEAVEELDEWPAAWTRPDGG